METKNWTKEMQLLMPATATAIATEGVRCEYVQ